MLFECTVTSVTQNVLMITTASCAFNGATLAIAFPTFTQSPACGDPYTYTYTIDGSATVPAWLTIDEVGLQFIISYTDAAFVGDHTI